MAVQKAICRTKAKIFNVSFEGNIGSGKTTSLNYLSNKLNNVNVIPEPVDKWTNVSGVNFLKLLYGDINRWSFAFEHFAQLTRFKTCQKLSLMPNSVTLMERSIFSARFCFTENLFRNGHLSETEYIVIDEWFKWMCAQNYCRLNLIVYLKSNPEVVYERIRKRSRDGENAIPLVYLKNLHNLHENWLSCDKRSVDETPVLTIDANLPQQQLYAQLDQYINVILGDK